MAELVDALVSGTSGESRGGSSPLLGTSHRSRDANGADASHSYSPGGAETEIEAHARYERTAVIDDNDDGLPGPGVCHGQSGAEGERAMSGGQAVRIEWLSAGSVLALPIMG